ncbi:MAG: Pr6Pr family membrane protein [Cyclobacteriaceae bacterium]
MGKTFTNKIALAIGAAMSVFAVVMQFYLMFINRTTAVSEMIIRFFSFFTILTNSLVALYFSALLLSSQPKQNSFFSKASTATAVAVYIIIVGAVYQFILRGIWSPVGWQQIVDELLHSVIPLYFVIYWLVFVPKHNIQWAQIPFWLIYPFVYLIFILVRGHFSGFYPYPFVDVLKIGFPQVMTNASLLIIVFIMLSAIMVLISRLLSTKKTTL